MSRHFPMDVLKRWVATEPASADAHLVYGARLLKLSWDARGYGRGSEVSEAQANEFFRRLALTRDALEQSARLHADDPTPWAYLIMTAIYDNSGEAAQREFFSQAVARDSDNWIAHMHRLTGLTEKWGGSHSRMFEFARESASIAKPGSLLPMLLTKAHTEYWKYLELFEGKHQEAAEHLKNRRAGDETRAAYKRALGSNRYEKREAVFARINTASWFWLIKDRDILRTELGELGGAIQDIHWRWAGAEGDLAQARKFAGL
jgi:hypothetical protein